MSEDETWIRAFDALRLLEPAFTAHAARIRICERAHSGLIRARAEYFQFGERMFSNHMVPKEFWWAEGNLALGQDWAAGDFSTWLENKHQLKAFGVTFARADLEKLLPSSSEGSAKRANPNQDDEEICEKLHKIAPSAALSYRQAALDINDAGRISFRGSALELREALREVLDHLAPDVEVTGAEGYQQEPKRSGPTMRQKVRFVLKNKNKRSVSDAPEHAVDAFEEAMANFTRAEYERGSKETHSAGSRDKVIQLRRLVVTVLHEVL
jgi:hypothetical protein